MPRSHRAESVVHHSGGGCAAGHRCSRRRQPRIQDRHDPSVLVRSDQSTCPLGQQQSRPRHRDRVESVASLGLDRSWRADITGSSGLGKGIRSITTNVQRGPGRPPPAIVTSFRAARRSAPPRTALPALERHRRGAQRSAAGPPSTKASTASTSSARSTERQDENSARVRPPAESMSSASWSSAASLTPSRLGLGRAAAQ